ncbi:MAG TPA: hypothetical protein VHN74_12515 [Candidatus Angelobacter sp.]|jgi:hypothetical protein|nr:hypothetical protein [Candidatus Angelobacter sp.]
MKLSFRNLFPLLLLLLFRLPGIAQNCATREEIPDQTKTGLEAAARQTFDQASRGDVEGLRTNAIPSLQSNFNGIAGAVNDNKPALAGATPQLRAEFLLDTGPTPSQDGRFYCGVFGANGLPPNGAEFDIPGLPAGKYSVVIQDVMGSKGPYSLTTIYQDLNGWKLAGFYVRPGAVLGHDGFWYLQQARDFKTKGQNHNAWFYYVTSWDLLAPVTFMDTRLLSKITQESTGVQPKDVPSNGTPVTYSANGRQYSITDMSVYKAGNTFDLSVKYSVPSTADFNATQADARSLANALATQYPELKDGFSQIWAHAVDPNGNDVVGIISLKPVAKP